MFNKKKKTMYVPDEDIMLYNKSKQETADTEKNTETDSQEALTDVTVDTSVENAESEVTSVETVSKNSEENDALVLKTETENSDKPAKSNRFLSKCKRLIFQIIPTKKDDAKKIVIKCVALVSAIALIVSGTYLITYFTDLSKQDTKIENVRNNYELNRDNYERNDDGQFSKFDVLKAQNKDVVGWLNIAGTEVDNPVYQRKEDPSNQYYVNHDMDGQSNSYGALFLDYYCNIDPKNLTQNQIIYGHNMRYGAMFGTLDEYRDINFYRNHPLISFDSLYEQRQYKIFAIMIVNDTEDSTFGYTYTAYKNSFINETDFMQWIQRSRDRSIYDINVDVKANDEIITLSTCCYDYDNARFVILGRLVRPDESTEVDVNSAVVNTDVLYSKKYYDKKKLTVPTLTSSDSTTSKDNTSSK